MPPQQLTRDQLYELVWTTPIRQLAPTFGISDVALTKLCRRLGIPTPGRGYWAQKAAGASPHRTPLPPPSPGQRLAPVSVGAHRPPPSKETPPRLQVPVPRTLRKAHEAIRALALALPDTAVDEHGRLTVRGASGSTFVVTMELHRRALLVLDGLAHALVSRGHEVALREDGVGKQKLLTLAAIVDGHTIALSMVEPLVRSGRPREDEEGEEGQNEGLWGPKYNHAPAGSLRLSVLEARIGRDAWADTPTRPLDDQLGSIVLAIEAEAGRRAGLERQEEERRHAAEVRRLREEEEARMVRLREVQAQRMAALEEDLQTMAARWAAARQIEDFVSAAEQVLVGALRDEAAAAWLGWARQCAQRLDPLSDPTTVAKSLPLESV